MSHNGRSAVAAHLMESLWEAPEPSDVRRARGKALRKTVPRSKLATRSSDARSPIEILDKQNSTRVQSLIPLRMERTSASPFAYFRGTAAVMAADLAKDPTTGLQVASCGDAHITNFGFYASPQRTLVFDLNDFDEAAWSPWEWDLKRLVTSIVIGGRDAGRSDDIIRQGATAAVLAYARVLALTTKMSPYDRYFASLNADVAMDEMDPESRKVFDDAIAKAQKRTEARAAKKLTHADENGNLQFNENPPTMTHLAERGERSASDNIVKLLRSVRPDIAQLLRNYTLVDVCRRVVGVGSVGTECFLLLLQDGDKNGFILQPKQAMKSVLEEFGGITQPEVLNQYVDKHGEGGRVVAMQQILQAVSDPFLGHTQLADIDLYVRQFHDMKGGIDVNSLTDEPFLSYSKACAVALGRAHSQSPNSTEISGYVGSGKALSKAIVSWAYEYAEQNEKDFEAFVEYCKTRNVAPADE